MKLDAWLATLRAASRPLDLAELHTGAKRIAARAQALTGNRVGFHVSATPQGARISADSSSPLARRALDRAVDEQLGSIQNAVVSMARERLTSG